MAKLYAGVSAVNITPPVGIDLTGFAGRPSPAIGIHDDLYAKCLVMDDGTEKIGILTMDLLGLDSDIVERVREEVEDKLGVPSRCLMLSTSHTHSGPATISLRGLGKRDAVYVEELTRKLIGAVKMAFDSVRPAKVGFGTGQVQIGINRRQRLKTGAMAIGQNPSGPVAPYVDVMRVDDESGRPMAVLFSHAAHPVVLGGKNLLVSADYPGYAMRLVERIEGCVAMFAQGCCGDVNSNPVGRTFEDARRLGTILGGHTIGVAESIRCSDDDVRLKAISRKIELPLQDPLPPEETSRLVIEYRERLEEAKRRGEHRGQIYLHEGMLGWAEDMDKLASSGKTGLTKGFEIQAIRITERAVILGMAGEVFVDYQIDLKRRSPYEMTMVFAYTNGCIGYVPTADAYPEGGYEVDMAYKYYGTLMLKPESDGIIRDEALKMLREMREESHL